MIRAGSEGEVPHRDSRKSRGTEARAAWIVAFGIHAADTAARKPARLFQPLVVHTYVARKYDR